MMRPWWQVLWAIVVGTLDKVFVEPVREGSPRTASWPSGLRITMGLAAIGYVIAAGLIVSSDWLRSTENLVFHNGDAYPAWSVTILLWLVVLTLALALTAALHTHPALTVALLLVFGSSMLAAGIGVQGPWAWVSPLALLALVVFWLFRVRRHFAWFEFPVVLILVTLSVYAPLAAPRFGAGNDLRPLVLVLVLGLAVALATPALVMAGYAPAEIAVSLAEWLLSRLRQETRERSWRPLVLGLALVGGLGVFALDLWSGLTSEAWGLRAEAWAASVLVVALVLGAGWLMLRRNPGLPPTGPTAEVWNRYAYLMGALWVLVIIPVVLLAAVGSVATSLGTTKVAELAGSLATSDWFVAVWRLIAIGIALRLIIATRRRGLRVAPMLLLSFGCLASARLVSVLSDGRVPLVWSLDAVVASIVVTAVGLTVVALIRRKGVERQLWITLLALLISAAVGRRELLAEPGSLAAGMSGLAVLLLGLIWRVLTDAGVTRRGTRWLPVPTRVLLFAANSLLAVVVLAVIALARQETPTADPETLAAIGTDILGTSLILGAIALGLLSTIGLDRRAASVPDTLKPTPPDEKTVIREPQP